MQSMWAGTLVFGLVEIPVRLGPATRPRELAFRQVHAEDGGRITFRRSCTACGADVPYVGVAKAYQQPDGALVPVTDDDLAAVPLEAAHRIEVRCFVAAGTIDPLLLARSYVLTVDTGPGTDRAPTPPAPVNLTNHEDTASLANPTSPAEPTSHSGQTDVTDLTELLRASLATVR